MGVVGIRLLVLLLLGMDICHVWSTQKAMDVLMLNLLYIPFNIILTGFVENSTHFRAVGQSILFMAETLLELDWIRI
jgi:hypothetical protein